ncbi:right-handed parallel beta-helix repeat-containing protein [Yoonia sp.]|uniref:right-handed parallel beta-helix repeat-containing protein n=1 Tax=Yoonia sp. TaxID=2212373 RepID=UPI0025EB23F7|nr:right-handed parallel beta-helix repeat-containing protein [Yoonia sp.]
MKGDISADFHAPKKRFTGARAQSGRVLTDADFNAAFDVLDNTLETLVRNLLCAAGSPDAGLKVLSATPLTLAGPDGTSHATYEIQTATGSFVLGGRAVLLDSPISSVAQSDWLSQILTPGVLPPAPVAGRNDLIWMEQIEGAVRAIEDRELQDRSLPADTTTRLRPQIKLRVLDDVPPDCQDARETLAETLRLGGHALSDDRTELLSGARLGLAFVDDGPNLDPCAPGGAAGYLGAENHTLKIMLTAANRFVWAHDHGDPLYRVQIDASNGQVVFLTEPRDPMLFPLPDQIIEILPWDVRLPNGEKAAAPLGHLARLTGHYDPQRRRVDYDGTMPGDWQTWLDAVPDAWLGRDDDPPRFFYARIWQAPTTGTGPDEPTGTNLVLPETGIALHFSGTGVAGDYWTASLRPNAPETVHPWHLMIDPAAGDIPLAPPIGPRRFFAPLALVNWPAGGGAPTITDCRNTFRRLCRIQSCCSYQVGDGHKSFGDFDSIQQAVDALPVSGGQICLLPGTHVGPIDLRTLSNIKISGCGTRSLVEITQDPLAPNRPGVWLDDATHITFCDFAISGSGGPVFGAIDGATAIHFSRLDILARQTAAIALRKAVDITIADCNITAEALARALEAADIENLLPLVFLSGRDLAVLRNGIIAETGGMDQKSKTKLNQNRVALGGLQIGGRSSNIEIAGNRIEGGNGHGVTLGSVTITDGKDKGGRIVSIPPWITIDDDGCVKVRPGGTVERPGENGQRNVDSDGRITRLRIRDNLIGRHGGCGISVAHWFIAKPDMPIDRLDDIEIDEVRIWENRIYECMQINLANALPVDAAFNSGYGGIALASATDISIQNNEIRQIGAQGRSPICGIYIRYSERLRITDNRISDTGRPANLSNPLLVGNIGGIVVGHVDGIEEGLGTRPREIPAAVITGNTVVTPEGRALELSGSGQMLVQGNTLTSHGNNIGGVILMLLISLLQNSGKVGDDMTSDEREGQYRAAIAQIGGSAVLIMNTGVNRNLALFGMATSHYMSLKKKKKAPTEDVPTEMEKQPQAWSSFDSKMGHSDRKETQGLPRGPVSFSDNMVTFDAISDAITLSLSSIAIVSLDDVGMHDNHCAIDLTSDFVLANALVFGLASCRVTGNRFREVLPIGGLRDKNPLPRTLLSAATFGLFNATEMNQGTHCFLTLGVKKPRIIIDDTAEVPTAWLDTNRHTIPDEYCARFQALSRIMDQD